MSQYRKAVQGGVLVRQKRAFLRWWYWSFNRSEEDNLNRMKNELIRHREMAKLLARRIPQEEARLNKEKDSLKENEGSHGMPYRDSWTRRKEPVRLLEDVKTARKKGKREPKPQPAPLFNITPTK